MPVQSPHAFIVLFLSSFDSITSFLYLISPLGSTPPRINETVTLTSLTSCSAKCILKITFQLRGKFLQKRLNQSGVHYSRKYGWGKKKLVRDAPHDSPRTMHYKETFNAYKGKQTISNKDQIFSQS